MWRRMKKRHLRPKVEFSIFCIFSWRWVKKYLICGGFLDVGERIINELITLICLPNGWKEWERELTCSICISNVVLGKCVIFYAFLTAAGSPQEYRCNFCKRNFSDRSIRILVSRFLMPEFPLLWWLGAGVPPHNVLSVFSLIPSRFSVSEFSFSCVHPYRSSDICQGGLCHLG